jgi:hypothetical protein
MARSGICIIADRYEGTLANYAEMRRLASVIRQALQSDSEPCGLFSLSAVLRGSKPPP